MTPQEAGYLIAIGFIAIGLWSVVADICSKGFRKTGGKR